MADVQYAPVAGDAQIAYEVRGDTPRDLLEIGHGMPFEAAEEQPRWEHFERRLESFSRLIRFDHRGAGLSDPASGDALSVEHWMADALAVLDATGSRQAAVMGISQGALTALLLAATHPERVSSLILINGFARLLSAPDYPAGVPPDVFTMFVSQLLEPGTVTSSEQVDLRLMAPSLARDEAFRSWWSRASRRSGSPSAARARFEIIGRTDLRELLPTIRVPVLVMHSVDNAFIRVEHGRHLADNIPGARFVGLPGADHLPWAAHGDPVADEVEEFVTGARREPEPVRALATVLISDIVGSTERARELGDAAWSALLDQHDAMVRRQLARFDGREVKSLGDGFLATFDGPARAIRCAHGMRDGAAQLGLSIRIGIHAGEIERRGNDVGGIAVHIASRVASLAAAGEVLVSRTVPDLVAGSQLSFSSRGAHVLKGLPGEWQLFVAES
jgi:pimeloyl-ACP methyl ester carboxylesterase